MADPIDVGKVGDVVAADGCSMDKLSFFPESQSFLLVWSSRGLDEFEEEGGRLKKWAKS